MQITMMGRHVEITPALREYAEQKLKKIARYSFKSIVATVRLTVEKYRHMAEIVLRVNGDRILAKEETDEMYQSIDLAMGKIEQRLRKYKEKLSRHKPSSNHRFPPSNAEKPNPIRTRKPHLVSTLALDDVLSRLAAAKTDYFVFIDDEDEKLKLVVRNKKDQFEMTELILS